MLFYRLFIEFSTNHPNLQILKCFKWNRSAKQIQGTSDGHIKSAFAVKLQKFDVLHASYTTGIGDRAFLVCGKEVREFCLDAVCLAFYIYCMNEEFIAMASEFFHHFEGYRYVGKFLPAVCDDEVLVVFFAAAEIKYEMFSACCLFHPGEVFPGKSAVLKNIGGDDHMACSGVQIVLRVFRADTASDLEPSRICPESLKCLVSGGFVVFRIFSIQKDDMSAFQSGVFV